MATSESRSLRIAANKLTLMLESLEGETKIAELSDRRTFANPLLPK